MRQRCELWRRSASVAGARFWLGLTRRRLDAHATLPDDEPPTGREGKRGAPLGLPVEESLQRLGTDGARHPRDEAAKQAKLKRRVQRLETGEVEGARIVKARPFGLGEVVEQGVVVGEQAGRAGERPARTPMQGVELGHELADPATQRARVARVLHPAQALGHGPVAKYLARLVEQRTAPGRVERPHGAQSERP